MKVSSPILALLFKKQGELRQFLGARDFKFDQVKFYFVLFTSIKFYK